VADDWRPTASRDALVRRAEIVDRVRAFFKARGVLEVETPLLGRGTASDPHLASFVTTYRGPGAPAEGLALHLQTSPELPLKRLLAAGFGPIFQLGKAFRDGEAGRRHNPELTMLEWYRPGWDHHRLMDEVDELLAATLGTPPAERLTHAAAFERAIGLDPHRASTSELRTAAARVVDAPAVDPEDRATWLQLLLAEVVEPTLGGDRPSFIHDFPASEAALARIRPGDPPLAERFEVFVRGVELANGYHELTDPAEQRRRIAADRERRRALGLPEAAPCDRFLAALDHGLPDSAGVAMGVDRLVMLALGVDDIAEVLAFPIDRA